MTYRNGSIEQNNKSRIRQHKYSQLIFDKGAKTIHEGRIAFSTNGTETIGYPQAKQSLKLSLTLYVNNELKISHQFTKCKTTRL